MRRLAGRVRIDSRTLNIPPHSLVAAAAVMDIFQQMEELNASRANLLDLAKYEMTRLEQEVNELELAIGRYEKIQDYLHDLTQRIMGINDLTQTTPAKLTCLVETLHDATLGNITAILDCSREYRGQIQLQLDQARKRLCQTKEFSMPTTTSAPSTSDEVMCPVCFTEPVDRYLEPCGHVLCYKCYRRLSLCPTCRTPISRVKLLFLPGKEANEKVLTPITTVVDDWSSSSSYDSDD